MNTKNGHTTIDLDYSKKLKKENEIGRLIGDYRFSTLVKEEENNFAIVYGKDIDECEWNASLVECSKELVQGVEDAILLLIRIENEKKKDLKGQIQYLKFKLNELRDRAISKDKKNQYIEKNNLNTF